MPTLAVILAAGKSTRMHSDVPKVLHEVCGRLLIDYVLDAARDAGATQLVVIVGHKAEMVKDALAGQKDVAFALQEEQHGTGHAVMMCEPQLRQHDGPVLVLAGDTPLLKAASLRGLLDDLRQHNAAAVIGTAVTESNFGLGRIVRDAGGNFERIVEQRDATESEQAIQEINTGCFAFDGRRLLHALTKITPENAQAQYYLTDCPAVLLAEGDTVIASNRFDIHEAIGVNTRAQLAEVHRAIQQETMNRLMTAGVTIVNPAQTYIDPRARIGRDTIVYPFTTITGEVTIGDNCRIGPHAALSGPLEIPDGHTIPPFTHREQ
jgi:bifunctional UDP-N-acetylglucosamine pyrophosphorylase / glucosamine-1-phosphate N-acetyltransferase